MKFERYVVEGGNLNIPAGRVIIAIQPYYTLYHPKILIHHYLQDVFADVIGDDNLWLKDHFNCVQRSLWLKDKDYSKVLDYIQPLSTPVIITEFFNLNLCEVICATNL